MIAQGTQYVELHAMPPRSRYTRRKHRSESFVYLILHPNGRNPLSTTYHLIFVSKIREQTRHMSQNTRVRHANLHKKPTNKRNCKHRKYWIQGAAVGEHST
jgi:hypothetical protein